jgi:hypothetical protein
MSHLTGFVRRCSKNATLARRERERHVTGVGAGSTTVAG